MPDRDPKNRVPAAARAFAALQGEDATTAGGGPSTRRRFGATVLALLVLAAFPLYLAASSTGLFGDAPTALAKGPNSGPGSSGSDDDDDSSGPGPAGSDDGGRSGDDDDTGTHTRTGARGATDDTSRPGASTRGTTRDNDTRTNSNTHTRTRGQTQTRTQGQTQTRTRTGS
ncbi:MAG TPA: hypothetical protein VEB65_08495 [Solirubrobacterales bacterium]|nr:hypothetical protein [Solirubrobacterales bacterium]